MKLGVKKVYNGAICYTPDGNPIVGPAWGLKNFWINEGHSFGITAAGGAGWQLAEWIVDGEPTIDMLGVEPRRYGNYATKSYLKAKNEEAYSHVFITHYPDEERPAARPLRTSPCYERMKNLVLYLDKNLVGKDQTFLQQMEWNKKMIGLLEDLNGLMQLKKNVKMLKKMLVF